MLAQLFLSLKAAGVPVSLTEYLALLGALKARVIPPEIESFYFLARSCLVKDERYYDRFDRVFAAQVHGAENLLAALLQAVPREWLEAYTQKLLSDEEKARIKSLGGWDEIMKALMERLAEQQSRHQGGNRWIGTGGTSPFGAAGYNPEGVRMGQDASRNRSAIKVWDRREYQNLDDKQELGTRNIKVALRRLRRFARDGASVQLDLDATIDATARNAGVLDLKMIPERHNAVKVLLFLDVGGSMSDHVQLCEQLFSAARGEFRHLEHFYFHNFVYEAVWRDNRRRFNEHMPTVEVLRTYGPDYKLLFVGDATMSPYEITQEGGSIEHFNDEAGVVWMSRLRERYPRHAWLNPEPLQRWDYTPSIRLVRELLEDRMFPLTPEGLDRAMRAVA